MKPGIIIAAVVCSFELLRFAWKHGWGAGWTRCVEEEMKE